MLINLRGITFLIKLFLISTSPLIMLSICWLRTISRPYWLLITLPLLIIIRLSSLFSLILIISPNPRLSLFSSITLQKRKSFKSSLSNFSNISSLRPLKNPLNSKKQTLSYKAINLSSLTINKQTDKVPQTVSYLFHKISKTNKKIPLSIHKAVHKTTLKTLSNNIKTLSINSISKIFSIKRNFKRIKFSLCSRTTLKNNKIKYQTINDKSEITLKTMMILTKMLHFTLKNLLKMIRLLNFKGIKMSYKSNWKTLSEKSMKRKNKVIKIVLILYLLPLQQYNYHNKK